MLDRFDLELSPGEIVALVGESGAGKSTVAALLLGLLRRPSGRITVGDVDLPPASSTHGGGSSPGSRSIQRCSGPALPTTSASATPKPRHGRSVEAAALAGADEFIRALPDGYATLVGDGDRTLSPGERRRIGLARAFLRDAPLVVLDEPTADLDPRSVEIVADAVRRLQDGRTMLLIAHRPELVQTRTGWSGWSTGVAVPEYVGSAA